MKFKVMLGAWAALWCAPGQTPDALKADVSFLASDALEGRATPSPGLTIASEFIAAGFRRAGLEPAGDDGYFQTAPFVEETPSPEGFDLMLEAGGKTIHVAKTAATVLETRAVDLSRAAVWKAGAGARAPLSPEQVEGKVLVVEAGRGRLNLRPELHPALLIRVAAGGNTDFGPRLREQGATAATPVVIVWDRDFREALRSAKAGEVDAAITAHIPAPKETPVRLRNVIGVLRGSDTALRDTCLVVSAHYDHLGVRGTGPGDHIFNGANDDASGTASVMEIAQALATGPRPKRSVVFVTFFGEELGEVGSRYYLRHPVFPLDRTVADINLEQLGRTDETSGRRVGMFNLTGFDFTDMPEQIRKAVRETGIRVVKDEANSDHYFGASDNAPFADAGVPSTTVSVAYGFPDYHGVGDEWTKLDYDNMAKVDHALGLAILALANRAEPPRWNAANPKTAAFVKARGK